MKCAECKSDMDVPGRPATEELAGMCLRCVAVAGNPDAIRKMKGLQIGYLINPATTSVRQVQVQVLDIGRLVDGVPVLAYIWSSGEILYVNDDGIRLFPHTGFSFIHRQDQMLYGPGVIVGREVMTANEDWFLDPPSFSLIDATRMVLSLTAPPL